MKPGWKKGTKITFPERGNKQPNMIPADLTFIIDEKPHPMFTRDGNDLVATHKIPLVKARAGYVVHLTALDGRSLTVPVRFVIHPGYEEVVWGEGMPIPKDPSRKGNLRVKFDIKFPAAGQKSTWKKQQTKGKGPCWVCGESDHWAINCKQRKGKNGQQGQNSSDKDSCWVCGESGHWAVNCKQRKGKKGQQGHSSVYQCDHGQH